MAEQSFDQAVRRLAQYRPFAHEGRDVQAALRDLVLSAAAEAGGGFDHLGEAQHAIKTLFDLEIEIDELRSVVEGLSGTGACTVEGGGFRLSDGTYEQLEEQAAVSNQLEERAFTEWREAVRQLEPELTEDDFEALRIDFDAWLKRVVSRHGVEAALLLYPENPRARQLYQGVEALGLNFLPERTPALRKIREQAIQLFIQRPTPEQRTYLSNLLNVSYFLTVLSLDPQASHLVQEQISGHRIYLDTNVLYRVLALSKISEVLSARRLLELTKELGFELAITPWTLTEMQESLRRAEQSVRQRALPPREWAHLMAEATTQEGFIKAYWIQYKEKGVTPEDFFAFYSALETMLAEEGIHVVDEGTQKVRDADVDEQIPILARVIIWERPDVVLRHDVKHRLLVEQLRGDGNLTFSNARYWFLTQDSALPRYAEIPRGDAEEVVVPFCASTSAWAQVVRSLVPRTEDLDQALVDLLASPYMRYRGGVSAQAVQEVVARIDQFQGVSAELASEVLLNGALVRDIGATKDPEERRQKIDNALIKSAELLHLRVEALSDRDAERREALRRAEAERTSSQSEVEAAHSRIRELEGELAARHAEQEVLSRRLSEAEAERQAAAERAAERSTLDEDDRQKLEERIAATEALLSNQATVRRRRGRIGRWVGASVLWLVVVVATTLLLALGVISDVWSIVGVFAAAVVLLCLAVWLGFGRKRASSLLALVALLIGLVAAIQQLATAATDDSSDTTQPSTTP
jgi:VIT1/CCC1 family predicted Fe2+/Mn2+ transporter